MSSTLPDIKTAILLWQKSLEGNNNWNISKCTREYIFHTTGIADAAYKIASSCNLNPDKAYVLGLLHDYGKIQDESSSGYSHFMFGYDEMNKLGFSEVARICLTHSFPSPDFDEKDYSSYPANDVIRAKKLIKNLVYDDYDKLIQLCDLLYEATSIITFENRIKIIRQRYNLKPEQTATLEAKTAENKAYFDKLCNQDIYKILNINK